MAKIVQVLTRPSTEYNVDVATSLIRDLDAVLQKLNTTYQQQLKEESEAFAFYLILLYLSLIKVLVQLQSMLI